LVVIAAVTASTALLLSCSKYGDEDVDLHGNGLTRYAERVLGVDPLAPTNPLVLIPVVNGEEPLVLTYEVPVRPDVRSNRCDLFLLDNGKVAEACEIERRTNGTYLVAWDTLFAAFGEHALQLELAIPYQSRTNVFGPKRMLNVTNLVQFTLASTSFRSWVFIEGKLQCRSADYKMEFFDTNSRLLRTIFGHTDKGAIEQRWDLQDENGRVRDDTEFEAKVYIAPTPAGSDSSASSSGVFPLPPYPLRFWRAGRAG
jgi:hypothetical protein